MTDDAQYRIDKQRLREAFDRASATYDEAAVLQREVAGRLLERLRLVRLAPRTLLDVGAGTGVGSAGLLQQYKGADVVALDLAFGMLQRARRRGRWLRHPLPLCADAESLPLAPASVDLIHSNLTLQWCNSLDRVFAEFQRVLRPGGLLMFTTFGPDTLKELRACWSRVDGYTHVNAFMDMHDIGDALVRAGFADPVMDMEILTLTYAHMTDLVRDLRHIGATNATQGRPRGLGGRARLRSVNEAYEAFRREDGRLPATYEVIYGHAWAPLRAPAPSANGRPVIPIFPV